MRPVMREMHLAEAMASSSAGGGWGVGGSLSRLLKKLHCSCEVYINCV